MEKKSEDFLLSCSKIDFGPVDLSAGEKKFYKGFNHEIISLCDSLPESTQLDALLFFIKCSGLSIDQELYFFKNFYVPSWSIIYWLTRHSPDCEPLSPQDTRNALTAHAMAMRLHSMDDHMNDGETPVNHLTLLLRSQSWLRMMTALKDLACGLEDGENIINRFMDDYYAGITDQAPSRTLEGYCQRFLRQMATWMIVPVLLTKKRALPGEATDAVKRLYGSFGIAWRLLDDIMDIESDMKKGAPSAIYVCLPDNKRKLWERAAGPGKKGLNEGVLRHIMEKGLVNKIKQRIIEELESAAFVSNRVRMRGLAREFRSLLKPFKESLDSR